MEKPLKKKRNYRFYVKPLLDETNEAIANRLNALGDSASTAETQKIEVAGDFVFGVYLIPHKFLTELERSGHRQHVRVFVQEGEGQIRPYVHFKAIANRLARTKSVSAIRKHLARKAF